MSLRAVFARAAQAMTQVGGEIVTYEFKQGGPLISARAVFSQPEEADVGFGRSGKASVRVEAMITAADLAPGRPQKGDLIAAGAEKGWRVETVRQDPTEAFFMLGLARQD
jgi:hypothetical protein